MVTSLMIQLAKTYAPPAVPATTGLEITRRGGVFLSARLQIRHSVIQMEMRVCTDAQVDHLPKLM